MRLPSSTRTWVQRLAAVLALLVGVPALLALETLTGETPVREGEPAPRTVIATAFVRVVDEEATEVARRTEAESAAPVRVFDDEAQAEVVASVREVFTAVEEARAPELPPAPDQPEATDEGEQEPRPEPSPTVPSTDEQLAELADRLGFLDDAALLTLVGLSDRQLATVQSEAIDIAQMLARQRITEDELDEVLDEQLRTELVVRNLPGETGRSVVEPLIRTVMRPTVRTDPDATAAARQRAADQVAEVARTWRPGERIVREGETVGALEARAVRQLGLQGTAPWLAAVEAFAVMLVLTAAAATYLRTLQPRVWRSGRKVLLIASLITAYALLVVGVSLLANATTLSWWYAIPAAGLPMLAALLVAPVIGVATLLPAVALVLLLDPSNAAVAVYVGTVAMLSVPLVSELSSRGDLRRASLRAALAAPVVAVVVAAVFAPEQSLVGAGAAAFAGGVVSAMLVQGALPFLESLFRLPTVTALLDLADRNHPLLRELEQKALGSYQHSVMVASLTERACRAIGANALLGSVAALYHDIGKVRQPHFFIENQQGIRNPHDDLEPEISAVIIQNHVVDGVEIARSYKLPPEVVAAIKSHHGTMVVTYFYRRALDQVGGDVDAVDVDHFRYKGSKPSRKEAAVLMVADCCEAATRAAAMERGTLPRAEIETTVDTLISQRLDDGQFDQADLTFQELSVVRDSIVDALVGIYHPRIAYPGAEEERDASTDQDGESTASPRADEVRVETA